MEGNLGNKEILNGFAAIINVIRAYEDLAEDVLDSNELENEVINLLSELIRCNKSLVSSSCVHNDGNSLSETLGKCSIPVTENAGILDTISKQIPQFLMNSRLVIPVRIDYTKNLTMLFEVDSEFFEAKIIAEHVLLSMLKANKNLHLRCADFAMGGTFFSAAHNIVSVFPEKSGRKVYTKLNEADELIRELDVSATKAISLLGGTFTSVAEYNIANSVKTPEFLNIIYLPKTTNRFDDFFDRLEILIRNRKRNGMSFIIVADKSNLRLSADLFDFHLGFGSQRTYLGFIKNLPFDISDVIQPIVRIPDELVKEIYQVYEIDTRFENHPEHQSKPLSLVSNDILSIPFAIDKHNILQHFQIGDVAPHALISGSTGSGKSVFLHTIIMQIAYNYHPDDVELWLIDYKEVEFNCYFQHRTPHFRVIAQDTSVNFSLSLLDLLESEYNARTKKFKSQDVKNINEYRLKMGNHALPRVVVFIDEFQILTQAVQAYSGPKDYRTILENLLRRTRAMGISFVLSSQTIASGLSGLTESARDQIVCRICLKHDDDNEIRETLMLSGIDSSEIITRAKNLRNGQGIYKRVLLKNEIALDGKSFEYKDINVLLINDESKFKMIQEINSRIRNDYVPKEEILVRGSDRIGIYDKPRHPIEKFITGDYTPDDNCIEWYPGAPTTLNDAFCVKIYNSSSANILIVGEEDSLRESIVIHSICGYLMNPNNYIIASFIDENSSDCERIIGQLKNISSSRLSINVGINETQKTISQLRRIQVAKSTNFIYLWYGLDKLKNMIFLLNQQTLETPKIADKDSSTKEEMMKDLMDLLSNGNKRTVINNRNLLDPVVTSLSFDDCKSILRQSFEYGPENNCFNLVLFNNYKALKKSGIVDIEFFENRIGTRMSLDDSYDMFGSSQFANMTDQNTVVYYSGSGAPVSLRPYLLPNITWYKLFNEALSGQGK